MPLIKIVLSVEKNHTNAWDDFLSFKKICKTSQLSAFIDHLKWGLIFVVVSKKRAKNQCLAYVYSVCRWIKRSTNHYLTTANDFLKFKKQKKIKFKKVFSNFWKSWAHQSRVVSRLLRCVKMLILANFGGSVWDDTDAILLVSGWKVLNCGQKVFVWSLESNWIVFPALQVLSSWPTFACSNPYKQRCA